jgi:hypothetical protein
MAEVGLGSIRLTESSSDHLGLRDQVKKLHAPGDILFTFVIQLSDHIPLSLF